MDERPDMPDLDEPEQDPGPLPPLVVRATERIRGTVLDDLLQAVRLTRILDLSYTLAAQAFVALIPLVLVITGAFLAAGSSSAVGDTLVTRLDLAGAAREAVHTLFQSPGSGSGIYWLGLVITLYSAFSLARRVSRAYTSIWDVHPLAVGQQWRGLVWVLLQVSVTIAATWLRAIGREQGAYVEVLALTGLVVAWVGGEYLAQVLLTAGQVARRRVLAAASLVSVGRAGVLVWSGLYLPGTLSRQAELYGPIGVVFGLFTWIFASAAVLVVGTMVAAVLTARPVGTWFTRRTPDEASGLVTG
jgi:membrane protein